MSEHPLVSVLISTFNEEVYIRECLESIRAQTYPNLEILILDDASTDRTVEILRAFVTEKDQLIVNEVNQRHHECFNRLLTLANGKYIKFVMADDYLMPTSIARGVEVLEQNPEVSLVGHSRRIVDFQGDTLFDKVLSHTEGRINGKSLINRAFLIGTNLVGEPNACLFRSSMVDEKYFWDLTIIGVGEFALWFKLLQKGDYYNIPEALCVLRVSFKSASLLHAGKMGRHFLRYRDKVVEAGYPLPWYIRRIGTFTAYLMQELRRLVYVYVNVKYYFSGQKSGCARPTPQF